MAERSGRCYETVCSPVSPLTQHSIISHIQPLMIWGQLSSSARHQCHRAVEGVWRLASHLRLAIIQFPCLIGHDESGGAGLDYFPNLTKHSATAWPGPGCILGFSTPPTRSEIVVDEMRYLRLDNCNCRRLPSLPVCPHTTLPAKFPTLHWQQLHRPWTPPPSYTRQVDFKHFIKCKWRHCSHW